MTSFSSCDSFSSNFDGRTGIPSQAEKLLNGTLKGDLYVGKPEQRSWTAMPDPKAIASKD